MKIKLECWWTNTSSLTKRFIDQFVSDLDLENFFFVDKNPDYTIVFGRTDWDQLETDKDHTFYFSQEPLWSPNQPKDEIHNFCSKIFISDKSDYPNKPEYIETFIPMFYGGSGESDEREDWSWDKTIKLKSFEKQNIISIIVRKDGSEHYSHLSNPKTSRINYNKRSNLGIRVSQNEKVHVYGFNWETNNNNIKGGIWNKHLGLDTYKFSIACENSIQKNYVSEKFWDCILTDTVPVYLGCNNINRYIDDDCYISLNDLSEDEMIDKINDIILNHDKYYEKYLPKIKSLKLNFFSDQTYNLWEKIKLEIMKTK